VGVALDAIDRAVALVTDPTDNAERHAALRSVTPDRINEVVFGSTTATTTSDSFDDELAAVGIGVSPGLENRRSAWLRQVDALAVAAASVARPTPSVSRY
jgi:hypothetical protein